MATFPGGFLYINLTDSDIKDAEPVPDDEGIPSSKNFSFKDVKVDCGTLVEAAQTSPVKFLNGFLLVEVSGTCKKAIKPANLTDAVLHDLRVTVYAGPFLTQTNGQGIGLEGPKK